MQGSVLEQRFCTVEEASKMVGISEVMVNRLCEVKSFPDPVFHSAQGPKFKLTDIKTWMYELAYSDQINDISGIALRLTCEGWDRRSLRVKP